MNTQKITMQQSRSCGRVYDISAIAHAVFAFIVSLAGVASVTFGFWLLAIREKNLGYINVTVAIAVIAGVALITAGVVGVVRNLIPRRDTERRTDVRA